jgi:hypothetical protein
MNIGEYIGESSREGAGVALKFLDKTTADNSGQTHHAAVDLGSAMNLHGT